MNKKEDLHSIRHSLSHLLASAVLEHYPDARPAFGPPTDTGFYYDFEFPEPISEDDLPKIEKTMREKLPTWSGFEKKVVTKEEALKIFSNNPYKKELIEEFSTEGEELTLYSSGPEDDQFIDLCKGGHVEDMSEIDPQGFTLSHIAGAYWRGDEKNPMLTRIYGLAFPSKKDLDEYKAQREEAAKRDHRKIGKELDLFTFSDLVGAGLPLFTPKGTAMRNAIVEKIQSIQKRYGFQPVTIPHITKKDLYDTSGHSEKFGDELFKVVSREAEFVLKPMNCPHHTQIYAGSPKSYKDLPVRYAETTTVYRDEQTGELLGLSRVRSLTQDDGHIFCTPEQIKEEIENIVQVIEEFYTSLGMYNQGDLSVSLSIRDPKAPEGYLGSDANWERAESVLEEIAKEKELPFEIEEGEAAFYGPKLDFKFKDALGRNWQLATIQLDFSMPERFGLEYTDSDGTKKTPVMIHRAIAGSLERFLSVIIEHFAGNFPLWLSPIQARVISISEEQSEYADTITRYLEEQGVRVDQDSSNDSLGKRIRAAKQQKIPYLVIIGGSEVENNTVTLEGREEKKGEYSKEGLVQYLKEEIDGTKEKEQE